MIVIAFAIATFVAFLAAPSMPLYSARDIKLVHFHVSLKNMTVSAIILAGVEIENDNIVGGDIHSTLVDIYYPDWNGDLQSIGYLEETKNAENEECERNQLAEKGDSGICISDETSHLPFFTVHPLGISTSEPGIITIHLQNIAPKTYLNILKDFVIRWGSIDLLVSGGAHVKSHLGLPLSLGIICDNVLDLTKLPIQIIGKYCTIERISTGWSGMEDMASDVKDKVMGYHYETNGDIFDRSGENQAIRHEENKKSIENFLSTSEMILEWHDF